MAKTNYYDPVFFLKAGKLSVRAFQQVVWHMTCTVYIHYTLQLTVMCLRQRLKCSPIGWLDPQHNQCEGEAANNS